MNTRIVDTLDTLEMELGMPHPLESTLGTLGRRARRLLLLFAVARTLALCLAVIMLLAAADWLIHFQDPGLRIMCSLALVAVLVWTAVRYLWLAFWARPGNLHLALRIERRFPELNDRLASTVEFLRQREDDPQAGSAALRRAVINEATADIERLDLGGLLDPRPAYRSAGVALAAVALAALLVWADPAASRIAMLRLLNPLGSTIWPKENHLAFADAMGRVALGQPFEVEVVDARGGALPDEVSIHYRFRGAGQTTTETVEPMRRVGKAVIARKDNVTRPFSYRATGGDDDSMPWIDLEVIEPPAVEHLQLTLNYPDYTGWPDAPSDPHLRALIGTTVKVAGRANKRLRRAVLQIEGGAAIPARLSKDGYSFSIPDRKGPRFLVERPGAYWLELTDREGFPGGKQARYEIRAVLDLPPTVNVDNPEANIFVTAGAVVPLVIGAKDDLAIRQVALHYARTDQSEQPDATVTLYDGPEKVQPSARPQGALESAGESRQVEYAFDLAPLALPPGTQVTLHATATDYRPNEGQSHPRRLTIITPDELEDRLAERENFILTELGRIKKLQEEARAQVRGSEIQIEQVGHLTRNDIDHLHSAELGQRQVERGLTSDAEGVTTQIAGLLADMANNKADSPDMERRMTALLEGIEALSRDTLPQINHELTSALKAAAVDRGPGTVDRGPGTGDREGKSGDRGPGSEDREGKSGDRDGKSGDRGPGRGDTGTRGRGDSPEAPSSETPSSEAPRPEPSEPEASEPKDPSSDSAQPDDPSSEAPSSEDPSSKPPRPVDPAGPAGPLAQAGKHQDDVIRSLEQMLGELSQWDTYRRFHRDVGQLRRDQEQVARETLELAQKSLTRDVEDLTSQQQADLKKLSARQLEMARALDKIQDRMRRAAGELGQSDPLSAQAISDALQLAQEQGVSGQMREAGRQVEENQVGQAAGSQAQVIEKLNEVLDVLANRRERELARLVKKLREAEADLAGLQKEQEGLRKKWREAAGNADPAQRRAELERLSRKQEELQGAADRLARQLRRLQADRAARSASRAGGHMGQSGEQGREDRGEDAGESAEQAQRDLDEAAEQLAQDRRQAEEDLATEQLARLEDGLKSVRTRQEKVLEETRHYDDMRASQGELTRPQAVSVASLAREQHDLEAETAALAEKLSAAAVFSLGLKRTAGDMSRSAGHLDERRTGNEPQLAQESALGRLAQLLLALVNDDDPSKGPEGGAGEGEEGEGGEGGQGAPPATDGIRSISELKLLKLMQQSINDRTSALDAARGGNGSLSPDEEQQFADLALEQGEVADLLLNLVKTDGEKPEDDPENLPDPDQPDQDEAAPDDAAPDAIEGGLEPIDEPDARVPGVERSEPPADSNSSTSQLGAVEEGSWTVDRGPWTVEGGTGTGERRSRVAGVESSSPQLSTVHGFPQAAESKSLDDELFEELGGESPAEDPVPAADPEKAESDDGQDAQETGKTGEEGNQPDSSTGDLDDELLRGLGDGEDVDLSTGADDSDDDAGADNPIIRLGREMREVEELIARAKSDSPTQTLQRKIVKDLDELIRQLQQQMRQQSSSQSSSKRQQSRRQQANQPGKNGKSNDQAGDPKNAGREPARDSSGRLRDEEAKKAEREAIEKGLKDLWGMLPQRERELLMQSYQEEFLPRYSLEIEDYFKALVKKRQR